jgi:hypothetical protein
MCVVLATSRLAGLDRFLPLAEFPLLIAVGSIAYFGFVAVFRRRALLGQLSFVRKARDRGALS